MQASYTIESKHIVPTVSLRDPSYAYDGTVKTPDVTVADGATVLAGGRDYTVSYDAGRVNAGSYNVIVALRGNYAGGKVVSFTIDKAPNPLRAKGKSAAVSAKELAKKARSFKVARVIKFKKAGMGKKRYALSSVRKGKKSYKKYFKVNAKTGKVTIKKNTKMRKGVYRVKIKVKAMGKANYKTSAWKTVTFRVKVR